MVETRKSFQQYGILCGFLYVRDLAIFPHGAWNSSVSLQQVIIETMADWIDGKMDECQLKRLTCGGNL